MADPSISTKQQRAIETMIRAWKTKLTWEKLTKAVFNDLGIKTTRQTLCTYKSIKSEYDLKKSEIRGASLNIYNTITKSDIKLIEKYERLKAENAVLQKQVDQQLTFIRTILSNLEGIPNIDLDEVVKSR